MRAWPAEMRKALSMLFDAGLLPSTGLKMTHDRDIDALLATIAQQRAVIETLRAAVEEYADDDNWDGFNNWTGRHTARDALAAVAAMEAHGF